MRKNKIVKQQTEFSILALDDDEIMTVTLQAYFQSSGYTVDIENDPYRAIERIRENHYDILLLDFLMKPICGDVVVEKIREFNSDIFIILLTGHKSMAPPIQTIRELEIQGYYEKSDRFDQLELLVESCVKSIRQMGVIRRYQEGLRKIVDYIPKLYNLQTTEEVVEAILSQTAGFLAASDIYLCMNASSGKTLFRGRGCYEKTEQKAKEQLAEFAEKGEPDPVLRGNAAFFPLVNEQHGIFGIIRADLHDTIKSDALQLFELYAKQAGSAISNVLLHTLLGEKNKELETAYAALRDNYLEIINVMRSMVDAKDIYTRGHSDRVAHYAALIAEKMGKSEEYVRRIHVAGIFHDIGKIGTADEILLKNSRLTDEEYNEIKKHSARGKKILSAITLFRDIAPIVEAHHERYDGKGYPNGLKGTQIPEEARIIAVADAFDAMTSSRRYRANMSFEQAVDELKQGRGSQFDAEMVDSFLEVLCNYDQIREELAWTYSESKFDETVGNMKK